MKKIAVIGGGYSAERDVSIRSAVNVHEALVRVGYEADFIDLKNKPDEMFMESLKKYDLVMPILHGTGGEDGAIQELMDSAGISYFGSGVEASKDAFNKEKAKEIFLEAGLNVPAGMVVNKSNIDEFLKRHKEFVLKPISEGSSVGTLIVRDGIYDIEKVHKLLEKYSQMLAEELIKGIEITVPILGDKALPLVAIFPPVNEEFDLENKYNGRTKEICPVQDETLPNYIQKEAMDAALKAHNAVGARHLSRVDMIVDSENKIVVLEINTMPGLTAQSLYPKSAEAAGLSFNDLVEEFVQISENNL